MICPYSPTLCNCILHAYDKEKVGRMKKQSEVKK